MILILSLTLVTSLYALLLVVLFPQFIGNDLVHAFGLHKLWPNTFEIPEALKKQHEKEKQR